MLRYASSVDKCKMNVFDQSSPGGYACVFKGVALMYWTRVYHEVETMPQSRAGTSVHSDACRIDEIRQRLSLGNRGRPQCAATTTTTTTAAAAAATAACASTAVMEQHRNWC